MRAFQSPRTPHLALLSFQLSRQIRSAPSHSVRQSRDSQGDRPGARCGQEPVPPHPPKCFMPSPRLQSGREGELLAGGGGGPARCIALSSPARSCELGHRGSKARGRDAWQPCFVSQQPGIRASKAASKAVSSELVWEVCSPQGSQRRRPRKTASVQSSIPDLPCPQRGCHVSPASRPHRECQGGGHYVLVMGTFPGSALSTAQMYSWKAGRREGGQARERRPGNTTTWLPT